VEERQSRIVSNEVADRRLRDRAGIMIGISFR